MNPGKSDVLGTHAANPATPSRTGEAILTSWCPTCDKMGPAGKDPCECGKADLTRSWPVAQMEDRITAQFEQEVRRRAVLAYKQMELTDPGEADKLRALYTQQHSEGLYNWEDDESVNVGRRRDNHVFVARHKMWGALHMMYLLLARANGTPEAGNGPITPALALRICDASPRDWMGCYMRALGIDLPNPVPPPVEPTQPTGEAEPTQVVQKLPPVEPTFGDTK